MPRPWDDCGLAPFPLPPLTVRESRDFVAELASVCRQLRLSRLRGSLFALCPNGVDLGSARERLERSLERLGPIGILPKGGIGFLLLDRCVAADEDAAVAESVRREAATALAPWTIKRFVALHYWTDEVASAEDLVRRLEDRAFRRSIPVTERMPMVSAVI